MNLPVEIELFEVAKCARLTNVGISLSISDETTPPPPSPPGAPAYCVLDNFVVPLAVSVSAAVAATATLKINNQASISVADAEILSRLAVNCSTSPDDRVPGSADHAHTLTCVGSLRNLQAVLTDLEWLFFCPSCAGAFELSAFVAPAAPCEAQATDATQSIEVSFGWTDRRELWGAIDYWKLITDETQTGCAAPSECQDVHPDFISLSLSESRLTSGENNLGNLDVNVSEPNRMLFARAATLADGTPLDFEITPLTQYDRGFGSVNGASGDVAAVAVRSGTSTLFAFCAKSALTGAPVVLPKFRLDFFDLDGEVDEVHGDTAKFLKSIDHESFHLPVGSEISEVIPGEFQAVLGTGQSVPDLPRVTNPWMLSESQLRRAVSLTFVERDCARITLGTRGPSPSVQNAAFQFVGSLSMVSPPCMAPTQLSLTLAHRALEHSFARARGERCVRSLSLQAGAVAGAAGATYKVQAAFPPGDEWEWDAQLSYTPLSHATSYAPVVRQIETSMAPSTFIEFPLLGEAKDPALVFARSARPVQLSPVFLVPTSAPNTTRLFGEVFSVSEEARLQLQIEGAVLLTLTPGADSHLASPSAAPPALQLTTTTGVGGTFSFSSALPAGAYTLHAQPLSAAFDIATRAFNVVLYEAEQRVSLRVLAFLTDTLPPASVFVLSWEQRLNSRFGLMAAFTDERARALVDSSVNQVSTVTRLESDLCLIFDAEGHRQAQPPCVGAAWSEAVAAEAVTVASYAQNTMYTLYAMLPTSTYVRRNCHGIDLETDPNLAGSPTVTRSVNGRPVVDCMGNCATGEGYCYSSYDGRFCAPCKLYNAGPGEVLCATYNVPDGYCRETPEHTCAHDGGVESQNSLPTREACNVNYDAFAAQNAHSPHNQCSGAQTLAQAKLQLVVHGQVRHTSYLRSAYDFDAGSFAVRLMCLDTHAQPRIELDSGVVRAMDESAFVSNLGSELCSRDKPYYPVWACEGSTWACSSG